MEGEKPVSVEEAIVRMWSIIDSLATEEVASRLPADLDEVTKAYAITLAGRGATTATAVGFQNATAASFGEDKTAGTANTAGSIKLFSAGDNAYYTTFTSGTQTANADYTLPTALPGSTGFLKSSSAGALSWDTNSYLASEVDGVIGNLFSI